MADFFGNTKFPIACFNWLKCSLGLYRGFPWSDRDFPAETGFFSSAHDFPPTLFIAWVLGEIVLPL